MFVNRIRIVIALFLLVLIVAGCQPISRAATEAAFPAPVEATPVEATPVEATPVETSAASPLVGDWAGEVQAAGQTIQVTARFTEQDGALAGTLQFPGQSAVRFPIQDLVSDGKSLSFHVLDGAQAASFEGALNDEGALAGTFSQAGYKGTFSMARADEAAAKPTSAEPTPAEDKPYHEEEVVITATVGPTETIRLAGTLSVPEGDGPFPALTLVTGSGPQDRNQDLSALSPGYKNFADIADTLTRAGYVVLRYDERGVGESTGDFSSATTRDFANDAEAVLAYLRGRAEVNPRQVGLLGHSEGGMVLSMVAAEDLELGFGIALAGPAVSGAEILIKQVQRVAETSGATPEQVEKAISDQKAIVDAALAQDREKLASLVHSALSDSVKDLTKEQIDAIGDVDAMVEANSKAQTEALLAPWMQAFLRYDPAPDFARSTAPILAFFGTKDVQVDAEQNAGPMKEALAGNPLSKVVVLENANHLFQEAKTGAVQEYATLAPHMMPEVLDTIVEWLGEVTGSGK